MNQEELKQRLIEWLIAGDISAQEQIITDYTEAISYIADFLVRKGVTIRERGEWIPVTERLPEDNTRVLGFSKTYRRADVYVICEEKWWDDEYWNTAEGFGITHWMPLPLPPETEKGGEGK